AALDEEVTDQRPQGARDEALALVRAGDEVADLRGPAGAAPLVQPHQADRPAAEAELGAPALPAAEPRQLVGHELRYPLPGRGRRPRGPAPQVGAVGRDGAVELAGVVALGEAQRELAVETQGERKSGVSGRA